MTDVVRIQVLDGGKLPVKAHKTDAGFDLFATKDIVFERGKVTKHPLGFRMELPAGTYAHIKGKSGLGCRGLSLLAEIVDESYRGEPNVVATNIVDEPIHIKAGNKVCQMIIHPFGPDYTIEQVLLVDENTDRGAGGFGSSGA